jgi:hypothetical protein
MEDDARNDVLTQSYEDLRDFMVCHKMSLASPRGLALFLRRGMPGWIQAWSRPAPSGVTVRPHTLEVDPRCARPLPPESAAILTNMALAAIRRNNP